MRWPPQIMISPGSFCARASASSTLAATKKFRDDNPKTFKAVVAALKEATESINADRKRAAEVYVKEGGGKESADKILRIMSDPQVAYKMAPDRILPYAQFMHQVGTLKNKPESWKDLFFPDIHDQAGS